MSRTCKKSQTFRVCCATSQTCYAHAIGAQQTFNERLTHAWGTLLKQYIIKLERACSAHWRALNVRQTRLKRIQCACNARGTYSKRISHTAGISRASRKVLSMFKNIYTQTPTKRAPNFSGIQRRAQDVHQAYPTYL